MRASVWRMLMALRRGSPRRAGVKSAQSAGFGRAGVFGGSAGTPFGGRASAGVGLWSSRGTSRVSPLGVDVMSYSLAGFTLPWQTWSKAGSWTSHHSLQRVTASLMPQCVRPRRGSFRQRFPTRYSDLARMPEFGKGLVYMVIGDPKPARLQLVAEVCFDGGRRLLLAYSLGRYALEGYGLCREI